MGHPNLSEAINNRIDEQASRGGIDVNTLAVDTVLVVKTRNSVYTLKVLEVGDNNKPALLQIQGTDKNGSGGRYFREPTNVRLIGSTWGTSMIKIGWIGYMMHMEIFILNDQARSPVLTSAVHEAEVIGPNNNYRYNLWEAAEANENP
jgi:hypothetical protein